MKKLYWYRNEHNAYCVGLDIEKGKSHENHTKSWWQGREYNYKIYRDTNDGTIWHMPDIYFIEAVGMKLSILMNICALNIAKEKDNIK